MNDKPNHCVERTRKGAPLTQIVIREYTMDRFIPFIFLWLIGLTGCQTTHTQGQIGSNIRSAIILGQPAEDIEQVVLLADDPSKAAAIGALEVMNLCSIPREIKKTWAYYREKDPSSTPSIEIFEIINRYKISVLRVLVPHGINLNYNYYGEPFVKWGGASAITPELLTFLLEHGYDANVTVTKDYLNALDFCARPGQGLLRYDHKYKMIKSLLKHGVNPNVMSMGQPILHQLITYNKNNPYLLEIILLLLEAGVDVNVVDKLGRTPLDIAMSYKDSHADDVRAQNIVDIIDNLKRFGAKRAAEI